MILAKEGMQYACNGIIYRIGGEITVIDDGPYNGLIGIITEIRDGDDKETENDSVDIYCYFYVPEIPCDREQLIEKFSELYGRSMTLEDISLDMVIMAPEMLIPLEEGPSDKKCM